MRQAISLLGGAIVVTALIAACPGPAQSDRTKSKSAEEEHLPGIKENAPLEIELWGGIRDLYKIAVPLPLGPEKLAAEVQQVASRDFTLSSMFEVINPKSYLADLTAEGMSIDKDPWVQVGAQGVTKCRVTAAGSEIALECKLFEVARGDKAVLRERYTTSKDKVSQAVHKWVNRVIGHFTNEEGVFGSQLLASFSQ